MVPPASDRFRAGEEAEVAMLPHPEQSHSHDVTLSPFMSAISSKEKLLNTLRGCTTGKWGKKLN